MRRCFTLALAATAVLGCTDGATPTDSGVVRGREGNGRGAMLVSVVSFRPFPDSSYANVRGATVVVSFVDTLPTDTTGTPPDSLMVAGQRLSLLVTQMALLDTIPVDTMPPDTIPTDTIPTDTIPTDTIPTDTIPSDTNPPPPPGCGERGVVVARGRTDEQGLLRVSRLRAGKYDVKVIPPERSGLPTAFYCGATVFGEGTASVRLTLFPVPPDSSGS